jgi:hypothetical protein
MAELAVVAHEKMPRKGDGVREVRRDLLGSGGFWMNTVTDSDKSTAVTNKRRSERVVLVVPIMVSVLLADGRTATEEAKSQVVNAHGGLLKGRLELMTGQEILLTNPRTSAAVKSRVVRAEFKEGDWLVAFAFEKAAPNFWPIIFPPKDWAAVDVGALLE